MIVGSNILAGASGQAGYFLNRSVRLRSSASAYFNRTPATASNRKTWTWSGWVKRGIISSGQQTIFSGGNVISDTGVTAIWFDPTDVIRIGGSTTDWLKTTQVFRDPSAWYHIVVAMDSTNATANNRLRLYVNGSEVTAFATRNNLTLNADYGVNQALVHDIGIQSASIGLSYFDGYFTEINFIDGQALTPTSFGEYNTLTGVWQPKKYGGTYGTNGFYLNFNDNSAATAAAIGKDSSGNGNNWTPNNISVTAGVTYDSMTDVPTLTNPTTANYCTYLPLAIPAIGGGTALATLTNGNLNASSAAANFYDCFSTFNVPNSGKWYFEWTVTTVGTNHYLGLGSRLSWTAASRIYVNSGQKSVNGTLSAYGASYTSGDIIGCAIDMDAGTLVMYKNNSTQSTLASDLLSALPVDGWAIVAEMRGTAAHSINFGQRPFSYTPPTGFVALNTYNLPTPTISNGATQFAATLYTGNGGTTNLVNSVNGISFQPDFIWQKNRSSAANNILVDSVRGGSLYLISNSTAADSSAPGYMTFNSNGESFTSSDIATNQNGQTYISWQWKASNAAAVTNTSGTISSQVSANTTAGFSIVTYTGTGANATVGHGLGIAPKMIIVKSRTVAGTSWIVYHASLGATTAVYLDSTSASAPSALYWQNTAPTSSVYSVGAYAPTNGTGASMVAYCFSEIAGYSKFGSYTGNGSSADGVFVYLGFRPRFVLTKRTDSTSPWQILDSSRDTYNSSIKALFPNTSGAEANFTQPNGVDFLSNGFKLRNSSTDDNASGGTYIYAAFAENPLKYSLGR